MKYRPKRGIRSTEETMPMVYTTNEDLERFGKLWDAWTSSTKPTRVWFSWWCVAHKDVPDEQKVAAYVKTLSVN
jgi:hypothetical protein